MKDYEFTVYVQLPDSLASFRIDHAYMAPESSFEYVKNDNFLTNGDFEFELGSPFSTWSGYGQQELDEQSPSGLAHAIVSDSIFNLFFLSFLQYLTRKNS